MVFRPRYLAVVGLFILVASFAAACGGPNQTLGFLYADGGPDGGACSERACGGQDVWDSLKCACVAPLDGGCLATPGHCLSGYVFDPLTCECVVSPDGGMSNQNDATTGCVQVACGEQYVWDALECECVPTLDAGCPPTPAHCAMGYEFDPLTCLCVPIPDDSGTTDGATSDGVCESGIPDGTCSPDGLTCTVGLRGSCTCTDGTWNCFLPP
jgi:hypothetical protein